MTDASELCDTSWYTTREAALEMLLSGARCAGLVRWNFDPAVINGTSEPFRVNVSG